MMINIDAEKFGLYMNVGKEFIIQRESFEFY